MTTRINIASPEEWKKVLGRFALAVRRRNVRGHLKQACAEGFAGALEKRARDVPKGTVPLMTPVSDRRLKHLQGPNVTRRQAWNTAVGKERADKIIDSAAKYRAAHPELFEGVFRGGNVDRPVPVNIKSTRQFIEDYRKVLGRNNPEAVRYGKQESAMYSTPHLARSSSGGYKYIPASIAVKKESPFRHILHELFHLDTPGTRPQEWDSALTSFQEEDDLQPIQRLYSALQYSRPPTDTGQTAQFVTDRTYPTKGRFQRHEIGSQLGTLRAHLEQQGVDTTSPDALRSAIQNLEQHIGDNDEVQRFHDVIHAPDLTPAQKKIIIDALTKLLPGIARTTRRARQGAPTYSTA